MTLTAIADELWGLDHEVRLPGGPRLPVRMTVWRLAGGALALHSPVPIDDAAAAALAALGDVAYLIAPSRLHVRWLADAARRYPRAAIWAAAGVAARHPSLAFAGTLGDDPPAAWRDRIDQIRIAGAPKVEETVFLDRPTGTLVCTDLMFHVTRPANLRTRAMLAMVGAGGGRLAASRAWRLVFVKDRAAARDAIGRVLAWAPRRIVPAHGDVVAGSPDDVRAALAGARLDRLTGRPALAALPAGS